LLSNKEYELLVCLAKNNRKVMTFEQIGQELLGGYIDADRRNIMMNASRLRKKMEGFVGLENMIETVWGKGYCFKG
jgi:DNA-binding response OmpR family regulator